MGQARPDYSFLTCLGTNPIQTMSKNLALALLARAKYLCMSSAHISQDEKKVLTIQTTGFPLIRLRTSATSAAIYPLGFFVVSKKQMVDERYAIIRFASASEPTLREFRGKK